MHMQNVVGLMYPNMCMEVRILWSQFSPSIFMGIPEFKFTRYACQVILPTELFCWPWDLDFNIQIVGGLG